MLDDKFKNKISTHQNLNRVGGEGNPLVDPIVWDELRMFSKAMERTKHIHKPKSLELIFKALPALKPTINMGLISRHIPIQKEIKQTPLASKEEPELFKLDESFYQGNYKIVLPCSVETTRDAQRGLFEQIEKLAKNGADMICVNELGYPAHTWLTDDLVQADGDLNTAPSFSKQEVEELRAMDSEFRRKLQQICDCHDAYILAGTHHNCESLYNEAEFFIPNEQSVKIQKLTAAKSNSVQEYIRTPNTRDFTIVPTPFGNLCVLICIDVFDLNMYARQFLLHRDDRNNPEIDIILVPAYSTVPLHEACKELSYFANCVVVYVNFLSSDQINQAICISGEYMKTVKEDQPTYKDTARLFSVGSDERLEKFNKQKIQLVSGISKILFSQKSSAQSLHS